MIKLIASFILLLLILSELFPLMIEVLILLCGLGTQFPPKLLFYSSPPSSLFHFLFQGFNLQPKDVACFPLKEKEKPPRSYFLYKTYILQPHLFKLERGWPFLYTSPLTPLLFLCAAFLLLYDLQNSTNFLLSFLYTYSTIDHVRSLPLISFLC